MGTVLSGLAIKTDIDTFDSDHFVKTVFSPNAKRVDYVDIRQKNKLEIVKTTDGYIWVEASLVGDSTLHEGDVTHLTKISNYFGTPSLIYVLNEYDSGGTYGYGVIENGQIIRRRVTLSYETTIEDGPLLDIERNWLEGERVIGEYDEDDDRYVKVDREVSLEELEEDEHLTVCLINKLTGELVSEAGLSQRLHREFMLTRFGYTIWDRYDKEKERISYQL